MYPAVLFFAVVFLGSCNVTSGQQAGLVPINTCNPCGAYQYDRVSACKLQGFLEFSLFRECRNVNAAIQAAKIDNSVRNINSFDFDLTECCGSSFIVRNSDIKERNDFQLILDAMTNLNDAAILMDNSNLLDNSVRELNFTMCIIDTLNPSGHRQDCVRQSQINSCTGGLPVPGTTCYVKMLFRYLINAAKILNHRSSLCNIEY